MHANGRRELFVRPIGLVRSSLRDVRDAPNQAFEGASPDRPNPIGLHRVTITAIESPTVLRVSALEAIDGTPILDLTAVMEESRDA